MSPDQDGFSHLQRPMTTRRRLARGLPVEPKQGLRPQHNPPSVLWKRSLSDNVFRTSITAKTAFAPALNVRRQTFFDGLTLQTIGAWLTLQTIMGSWNLESAKRGR